MFNQTITADAPGGRGAEPKTKLGAAAAPPAPAPPPPNPELSERPARRRFTAEYKLRVLAEADACTRPGEIGELMRREGLYSSRISHWRRQRKEGALRELGKPRGRKPADRRDQEIAGLRRRAERAEAELQKAHKVIEVQGKLSALLEQMLSTEGAPQAGSNGR